MYLLLGSTLPSHPLWFFASHKLIRSGPGGVEIKDRAYKARMHKRCFLGDEAVTWMVKNLRLDTREEGVLLGTSLLRIKAKYNPGDNI